MHECCPQHLRMGTARRKQHKECWHRHTQTQRSCQLSSPIQTGVANCPHQHTQELPTVLTNTHRSCQLSSPNHCTCQVSVVERVGVSAPQHHSQQAERVQPPPHLELWIVHMTQQTGSHQHHLEEHGRVSTTWVSQHHMGW